MFGDFTTLCMKGLIEQNICNKKWLRWMNYILEKEKKGEIKHIL